jgi:hypothetical protein
LWEASAGGLAYNYTIASLKKRWSNLQSGHLQLLLPGGEAVSGPDGIAKRRQLLQGDDLLQHGEARQVGLWARGDAGAGEWPEAAVPAGAAGRGQGGAGGWQMRVQRRLVKNG